MHHTPRQIALAREWASKSSMLHAVDGQGRRLYTMTSTGNIRRTMKVSRRVRQRVHERDQGTCQECGASGPIALEVAHIVAYRNGGPNTLDNLRLLCRPCHIAEGVN